MNVKPKDRRIVASIVLASLVVVLSFAIASCGGRTRNEIPNGNPPAPPNDKPDSPSDGSAQFSIAKPKSIAGETIVFTIKPDRIAAWATERGVDIVMPKLPSAALSNFNRGDSASTEDGGVDLPAPSIVVLATDDELGIEALKSIDGVLFVAPHRAYRACGVERAIARLPSFLPDDPYFVEAQLDETTIPPTIIPYQKTTLEPVSVEGAWDFARGGGILVAIVSSGVYDVHPDLANRISEDSRSIRETGGDIEYSSILADEPYTTEGAIGTYLAGIVAADFNNGRGIAGIAPECELLILKTGHIESNPDPAWVMTDLEIAAALTYAVNKGAKAILLPVAVESEPSLEPVIESALAACEQGEVIVVVPAGDSDPAVNVVTVYPANSPRTNVITVGGLYLPPDVRLSTSNYELTGGSIDIAAPGFALIATDSRPEDLSANPPVTGYLYINGTAGSAAIVAGTVALIAEAMCERLFQAQVVRDILTNTVDTWDSIGVPDALVGKGRLNINRAVAGAYAQVNVPSPLAIVYFLSSPTPSNNGTANRNVYLYTSLSGGTKPYKVRIEWGDGTSFPPGQSGYSTFSTGTFSHVFTKAGIYPATIAFKDAAGQERVKSTVFTIIRPLTAAISALPNPTAARQYLFNASYMNADITNPSFAWDLDGDWQWDSFEQNPVYAYEEAGTYTINFQMADSRGAIGRSMDLVVP
jgi:hypothetical protein